MRVNKTNSVNSHPNFKGYWLEKDAFGSDVVRFNNPNVSTNDCYLEIYSVIPNKNIYGGYELGEKVLMPKTKVPAEGLEVKLNNLDRGYGEALAYRFVDKEGNVIKEPGPNLDNGCVLLLHPEIAPRNYGLAVLTMPDSHRPGAEYAGYNPDGTSKIIYNKEKQKQAEQIIQGVSNSHGGTMAGIEYDIPKLKEMGTKVLYTTPLFSGDDISSHGYLSKNNFQIASSFGNLNNYKSLVTNLYKNGISLVDDAALTSSGIEGTAFQYALRWADKKAQSYYWFRMQGLDSDALKLGILPQNNKNIRLKLINPISIYDEKTGKVVKNPNYDPNKETFVQTYDKTQVLEEDIEDNTKFVYYKKDGTKSPLSTKTYKDSILNYKFEISPEELDKRLRDLAKDNRNSENKISLDSVEALKYIAQFSNFHITENTEGGYVGWDGNPNMPKYRYNISGYDEKLLQSIVDPNEREYERSKIERAIWEMQDIGIQSCKYKAQLVENTQYLYSLQILKDVKTYEDFKKKFDEDLLPQEALVDKKTFENIIDGWSKCKPKGELSREDVTLKALMGLPLEALEFADNTIGVLGTSYFSNRATSKETLGKTRFELMKENNPHLVDEYRKNYLEVNSLYENELQAFANKIIEKLNTNSKEKLLDEKGNYTFSGEYIMDLLGGEIAKYAFLKSLMGEDLKPEQLENGSIVYNYEEIKEKTSLKNLGINEVSPEYEAEKLQKLIKQGLSKLSEKDVDFLVSSISKQVGGADLTSFRLMEATVSEAGKGLNLRIDAIKDSMDMDAVRNGDSSVETTLNQLIEYYKILSREIVKINPNANTIIELTDLDQIMKAKYGQDSNVYEGHYSDRFYNVHDIDEKLFNETFITTETGYPYFFTDLLRTFSRDFEKAGDGSNKGFVDKLKNELAYKNLNYVRNLNNIMDNQDKPSVTHGMALDMELFFSDMNNEEHQKYAAYVLSPDIKNLEDVISNDISKVDFSHIAPRAIAMSLLMKQVINEDLKGIASDTQIAYLNKAIKDLTQGKFYKEEDVPIYSNEADQRQKMYAALDFRRVIKDLIIEQAEHYAAKDGILKEGDGFANRDEIFAKVFRSATEPAVQKTLMYAQYMSALPGMFTLFMRDMYCALGYEEKAKNPYLQNRNPIPFSELEEGPLKDYISDIEKRFIEAVKVKTEVKPLNNGAMYAINLESNEDNKAPSYMMQSPDGDAAIVIFNPNGIGINSRHNYFKEKGLNTKEDIKNYMETNNIDSINPENPYIPIQDQLVLGGLALGSLAAIGTKFINANGKDASTYVVNEAGKLVKEGSGEIVLNGKTAKNGVMILRKLVHNIPFKSRSINKQYQISAPAYNKNEEVAQGKNLSVIK